MKNIYLDYAAATSIAPQSLRAMTRASSFYANPSSFHDAGRAAADALLKARSVVAGFLNARTDEIIFCSSGSEANTLAILGSAQARGKGVIVTNAAEHLSVLQAAARAEQHGHTIVRVGVDGEGRVAVSDVMSALRPSVTLVSVMYANNEIGTIQPIAKIGRAIAQWRRKNRSRYPLFHVDACQATTTLDMDVQRLGADLLTLNGAKAYGPHGTAVLFVRRGVALEPLIVGGKQEQGRRAGTEDVAGAVGLAAALRTIRPRDARRLCMLRDRLIDGLRTAMPDARLNGPIGEERLAGNVNISIPGCDSESLLLELDRAGIHAGAGSACTAHSVEPSHVLKAIGTPKEFLRGVLRLSLGRQTTRGEIDEVVRLLPNVVARVRARHAK